MLTNIGDDDDDDDYCALDANAGSTQQQTYTPIRKMVDKNLQRMSLRTVLRLTTGVPLFLGIVILVAVSMHLMTSNATGWMAPWLHH